MKVILLQNIARIGKKYEVKNVPDGHALNFLIPKKLAELATPHNLRRVQKMTDDVAAQATETHEAFMALISGVAGQSVEFVAPANEQGHLFKGIKAADIATHLAETGHAVTVDYIDLPNPIKETGEHTISLMHGDQKGNFVLNVVAK